jgi:hypothetical protein
MVVHQFQRCRMDPTAVAKRCLMVEGCRAWPLMRRIEHPVVLVSMQT